MPKLNFEQRNFAPKRPASRDMGGAPGWTLLLVADLLVFGFTLMASRPGG